jgi:hypothetical protein
MSEITFYSLIFAGAGILLSGVGIPLMLGKVPPNSFYGCRTTTTLANPQIWYEANRISGKDFLISGAITFAASLAMLAFGQNMSSDYAVTILLTVLLLSIGWTAWHSLRAVSRI